MKQYEAVIKVMEENGGFATLGFLYRKALLVPGVEWQTKTPFASIRRIVQDERFFFKIRPGLWALKKFKSKLPSEILLTDKATKGLQEDFSHTYYQGLIVETGNLKNYQTFVPNQDKNKPFLNKKIGDIISVRNFYHFGYEHVVRIAQTIDVTWFNQRNMPYAFFEVEHSTNISNSLLKFVELQDFYVSFFIVADQTRKREFEEKVSLTVFAPIKNRIKFLNYNRLSEWHAKTHEIVNIERNLKFKCFTSR